MREHRSDDPGKIPRRHSGLVEARMARSGWILVLSVALCLARIPFCAAADPPVTAAAFTPDGESVIVGSQAGLRMFSWPSLTNSIPVPTQLENIHHIAFSPNGQQLLVAGGIPGESGTIEISSWPDLAQRSTISAHDDVVYAVSWSPNGTSIATAGADGFCKVIAANSGQIVNQFSGHSRPVLTIGFLDADHCISGSVDQTIRLWRVSDGNLLRTLNNHVNTVNMLTRPAPGADQKFDQIASASEDCTVRIWQPRIGRLVKFARLPSAAQCLVWSADFRSLHIATKASAIHTVDVATMKVSLEQVATVGFVYELLLDSERQILFAAGQYGIQRIEVSGMTPVGSR